jgi:hypothetical protein
MKLRFFGLLVSGLVCAAFVAADEEDSYVEDGFSRCVNIGLILRTKVVDDSHVIFVMRNDELLLNTLRSRCSGLARRGSFTYKINSRSLCELDRIAVIDGGSFSEPLGRSCSLGRFRPVTMEDLSREFAPVLPEFRLEEADVPPVEQILDEDEKNRLPNEEMSVERQP